MPRNILSCSVILLTFFCTIQGQGLSFHGDVSTGSGGGDVSASGNEGGFLDTIREISSIPFRVPGFVINVITAIIRNLTSMFGMVGKIPLNVITTVGRNAFNTITSIPNLGLSVVGNTVQFNGKVVGSIGSTVETIIGEIVKILAGMGFTVSSAGIEGITMGRNTIEEIFSTGSSIFSNVIMTMSRLRNEARKTFKLDKIMQLPVIKQVAEVGSSIFNRENGFIVNKMDQFQEFINGIVKDNKEGILPILEKICTIAFPLINSIRAAWDSGSTNETNIHIQLGPWDIELGPSNTNQWKISGIGGETIGNMDSSTSGAGGSSQSNSGKFTTGSSNSDDKQNLSDFFGQLFNRLGGSKSGGSGNSSSGGLSDLFGKLLGGPKGSNLSGSGSGKSDSLMSGGSSSEGSDFGSSNSGGKGSLGSSGSSEGSGSGFSGSLGGSGWGSLGFKGFSGGSNSEMGSSSGGSNLKGPSFGGSGEFGDSSSKSSESGESSESSSSEESGKRGG